MSVYTKYKPSGIEWLGEIPEHWISTRVKNAMIFDIGGTPSRNNMEYFDGENLWVSISDLNGKEIINDTKEKITDEAIAESNCKLIPQGSLLFSFKLSVGHIAFAGKSLYTNEAIAAFRPSNRLNVRLLKYLLQIEFESNANTNIYGAYLFNKETLGTAKIVFSENSKEQTAIANYLDDKTSKLDQLINNKKTQIKKLQEIRQIEINTAVTKGLDPKVKYKPTGIEWLGEIPEHWEVKRLKNVTKIVNGSTPKSNIEEYWDGEITWVTPGDISKLNGFISESEKMITKEGYLSCGTEMVPKGSTILTCRAPIGNAVIAKKDLCTNQGCKSLIPLRVDYRYLYYFVLSSNEEINSLGQGTTFLELSRTNLGNTKLSLPNSIIEQAAIANYLDDKTGKIDQLVSNLENQIKHLQEVRKIEIYNAVTGKIKVA